MQYHPIWERFQTSQPSASMQQYLQTNQICSQFNFLGGSNKMGQNGALDSFQHSTLLRSQFNHLRLALMLLSIKSIAALSLVPLSFAKLLSLQDEQGDFCNFIGPFNRINPSDTDVNLLITDVVQYLLPNPCPRIAGQLGVPVCTQVIIEGPNTVTPKQIAQDNHTPNLSPPNQLVIDTDIYRSVSYYHFPTSPPFSCPTPIGFDFAEPVCRYCAVSDYAPELRRDLIYTPTVPNPNSSDTLNTSSVTPFNCGSPKCPSYFPVPGTSHPTKYARLSAAYCTSNSPTGRKDSPYGGLLPNFNCSGKLVLEAVRQKWGCYLEIELFTVLGPTIVDVCDDDFTPICYYDIPKPYSYLP